MFHSRRHPPLISMLTLCCIVVSTASPAHAVSLQTLLAGNSLTVGNTRFSNWSLVSADATSGTLPDWSLVNVNPLASDVLNPGLQVAGNGQLTVSGLNGLDVVIEFQITPVPGGKAFTKQALSLTSPMFGGESGTAVVTQEATRLSAPALNPTLVMADNGSDVFILNDDSAFEATSGLTVRWNLLAQGITNLDSIAVTSFTSHFQQTGPVVLGGDYNDDGQVNLADYTVWRDHLAGPPGSLANDVEGGVIGTAQYARWKSSFGAQSPGSVVHPIAIPEPNGGVMLLGLMGCGLILSRLASAQADRP